jgi:hypothetical protein
METLFNKLSKESNGEFIYETKNKFFDIEISVSYFTQTIEVRYYKGSSFIPYKKEVYSCLHGMFGADTLENKFQTIISNFN